MQTALYAVWFLIPLSFLLIALWSKLEDLSGRERHENVGDYIRQGGFLFICAVVCVLLDSYLLEGFYLSLSPDWIPLGFYQVLLFPFVLVIMAKLIGPSKKPLVLRGQDTRKKPGRH